MKIVQGRFLLTSLVRNFCSWPYQPLPRPVLVAQDPFGRPRPRPIVMEAIEIVSQLHPDEKMKFAYIFSDLLGLPHPPKISTEEPGEKFAVKLMKFDKHRKTNVLREVAWVKSTEEVRSLSDMGLKPSVDILNNVPSVVKQGVTKEEASEIIAKIKAAGGVAVMVPME